MKTFNPLVFVQVRNIAPTMLFACLVFFAQVALGQETPTVKATIKGPSTALAGTLVFLSHQDAVGENKVWIIPEELKSQSATCGSNIFFSIPSPGKYQFGLIVADKTAAIDYQFHTIDVVGMLPTTPPGTGPTPVPTPVPTPTPVPSPNFDSLRVVSRTGIDTLKDASTTQLLQTNLIKTINSLPPTLPEAKGAVTATIELCFSIRQIDSKGKDWLNVWRIPVDREIAKYNPQDVGAYRECMKAVVRGLCVNGVCPNIP
jgi:hypothetical protein